jgi:hypothetical protein
MRRFRGCAGREIVFMMIGWVGGTDTETGIHNIGNKIGWGYVMKLRSVKEGKKEGRNSSITTLRFDFL